MTRRKYKPKLRFKKKKEMAVKAILILIFAGISAAAPSFYGSVKKSFSKTVNFSKENISSVKADLGNNFLDAEIKKTFSGLAGMKYSSSLEKNIREYFLKEKPFIGGLEIKHNPLTGTLSIKGKEEKPCAKIKESEYSFILRSGRVAENPYEKGDFLEVSCKKDCRFDASFAAFVEDIKKISENEGFYVKTLFYEGANSSPRVEFSDGSVADWGGYEFTQEKLKKLKTVFEDLKNKSEGPYKADLRFFENGKIIISQRKSN
ncbi:MAG: hypothetical protein GX447_08785 [Elusimicrobia bacterium]|nr:hypothetical protein [Elusimicrobiota bacterium]